MATDRPRRAKRATRASDTTPPMTADEYLALDNMPASEPMPEAVEVHTTMRVTIHPGSKRLDPTKLAAYPRPRMRRLNGRAIDPHYGVFGPDDRQVYYPSGYPWTCIGTIFVWKDFSQPNPQWSGSGVLIGGRVVLTAGHIAPWGSGNWAMRFVPAYYDGGSTLGAGLGAWVSDYWGYNPGEVSAWDMVVLRLYTPLDNTYGYFGA